jgi:hypothetical protein
VTLPQFDTYVQGLSFFTAPAIADVTGDGTPDIVQAGDSGAVTGLDGSGGGAAAGWPKWTGGFSLFTPAVGDLTGTGTVSVATTTREGYLYVWDTPGLTRANTEAWHWHQNDRNTGHYGADTRPPAAVRDLAVSCTPSGDSLTFTAPGDDWNDGTAASYQVFRSDHPITQDTLASAAPVAVGQPPRPAGTRETIHVADQPGACDYAVRAVDAAGNIGPVRVSLLTVELSGGPGHGSAVAAELTNTAEGAVAAAAPSLALAALTLAAGTGRSRRRRRRGGR